MLINVDEVNLLNINLSNNTPIREPGKEFKVFEEPNCNILSKPKTIPVFGNIEHFAFTESLFNNK